MGASLVIVEVKSIHFLSSYWVLQWCWVCGVCWCNKKKGTQTITTTILQDIRTYQYSEYSLTNVALPSVVCTPCRLKLSRCRKVFVSNLLYALYHLVIRTQILRCLSVSQALITPSFYHHLSVPGVPVISVLASFARKEERHSLLFRCLGLSKILLSNPAPSVMVK